jgi:hypothetical protein
VNDDARVDTRGPQGAAGNWLLDPHNITIDSGSGTVGGATFATTPGTDTTISHSNIETALGTSNLTLQANTDIVLTSSISVSASTANTLTLQAGRSILLNGTTGITYLTGNVVLSANDPGAVTNRDAGAAFISSGSSVSGGIQAARVDLILNSNGVDGSFIGSFGTNAPFLVQASSPTYIKTLGANAYLSVADGTATSFALGNSANLASADLGTGSLSIRAAGVTQGAPVLLNNLTITLPNSISSGNAVALDNALNAITGTVNIAAMGGSPFSGTDYVKVINSQALTIGVITDTPDISSTDRGSMTLQALAGDLTLTGNIDIGLATLDAAGSVTQTGGVLYSHATTGGAGGTAVNGNAISLPGANILEHTIASTGNGSETAVTNIGQLAFVSGTDATLNFALQVRLQAAIAGGALSVTTTGSYLLKDAANDPVTVYNAIDIYNPVTAAGLITLHAAGDIRQQVNASTDVHITTGAGLIATSDNGLLQLADGGHGIGTVCNPCTADAGNQVSGYGLFNSLGNTNFTNTVSTTVGIPGSDSPQTSVIGGNLDVEVTDANQNVNNGHATLTMDGRVHTQQTMVSGDTVLHAAGDLINNIGNGTIIATNLSLVSDYGTVGASNTNGYFAFGDGTDGNGVLNIHASAPNGGVVINPGNLNIGTDLAGPGIQAQYALIFGNGTVTQNAGSTGTIVAGSLDVHAAGSITLNNPNNAADTIAFTTASDVVFNNSVATTINRGSADHDVNGNQLPAGNIDIEVADPSGITLPGIFVQGNSLTDSIDSTGTVLLHAAGAITSSTNPIIASTVRLLSDAGAVGTTSKPMLVTANTLVSTTSNQDIAITAQALNGTLIIGDGTTGINAGTGNVALSADSAAVTGATTIMANNLRVSGSSINFADVEVSTLSASTSGGSIDITSNSGFGIANVTGAPGTAGIDSHGGNVRLIASSGITQAGGDMGKILAGNLVVDPAAPSADITLDNVANQVTGTLSLVGANNVSFANSVSTHIGTSSAGGSLKVISAGDLEIVSGATLTSGAGGDAILLAAAGNFINSSGSSAIQLTGGGRFLIYSRAPASDIFNGLNSGNTAVWNTAYPAAVSVTGNRYIFANQPIITVTANNLYKTYGTDASASVASDYFISGLQAGVANAYLGDTAASAYSGIPSVTSAGAAAGAQVGGSSFAISISSGNFAVTNEYGLLLQNAQLTVIPATLTYTARNASKAYGAENPAFSGTVSGFVNGETLSTATTGALTFITPATATSGVGNYAINGSGLMANNYVFVQAEGNSTALVINPASSGMSTNTGATGGTGTGSGSRAGQPSANGGTGTDAGNRPRQTVLVSFSVSNQNAVNDLFQSQLFLNTGIAHADEGTTGIAAATVPPPRVGLPALISPIQSLMLANIGDQPPNDAPSSSDLAAEYVAQSLDGGPGSLGGEQGGAVIVPGLLRMSSGKNQNGPSSNNDFAEWGNTALWQ